MKLLVIVYLKEEVKGGWDGVIVYDYKVLGVVVDCFNVMIYDFSWSMVLEGFIVLFDWVEGVMKFMKIQVDV